MSRFLHKRSYRYVYLHAWVQVSFSQSSYGQDAGVWISGWLDSVNYKGSWQQTVEDQEKQHAHIAQNLHVLLVDDEYATQFYVKRLLEKNGYEITLAKDGEQALDKLAQNEYDCVLMDVQMPVLDGVEATKKIR